MNKSKQFHRKGGYIRRFEQMLGSAAYRDLTPVARCLLEEFQRIYRPGRNGKLSISTANASKRLNVTESTAIKAFRELAEHGFIKLRSHELWQQRRAREWTLTFEPFNDREPTDEWMEWSPEKPFPIPGRKNATQKTRAALLKNQGQTAKQSGAEA